MSLNPRYLLAGGIIAYLFMTGRLTVKSVLMIGGGLLSVFVGALYVYQEKLLYQPRVFPQFATPQSNPQGYRHPAEQGLEYEDVTLTTSDNVKLHAWFIRPNDLSERKERATLLFFHANAGNMGFRLDNIKHLVNEYHLNVLIVSYRGYGNSEGTPNEAGLLLDADAVWDYITNRNDVDQERLIVFGRSLGGSVAIALAAKHSPPRQQTNTPSTNQPIKPYVRALIVENTFTSIADLVDTLFPILRPLKPFVLRLDWAARKRIASVTVPILFLSGTKDEVVPASHMQDLYDAAVNSEAREILRVSTGLHNDTWQKGGAEYVQAWHSFLQKHCQKRAPKARITNNL